MLAISYKGNIRMWTVRLNVYLPVEYVIASPKRVMGILMYVVKKNFGRFYFRTLLWPAIRIVVIFLLVLKLQFFPGLLIAFSHV